MNKETSDIVAPDTAPAPVSHWYDEYFQHELPEILHGYPLGWMSWIDMRAIYNAARRTRGPVLEIGPFIGRSTTALAAGLRDREAQGAAAVPFDTIDYGITSVAEWADRFDEVLKPEKRGGRVMDAVYHPGGTIAVLIDNLKKNGLLGHVTSVTRGDFLTSPFARDYSLIFCDATHDEDEIRRNVPRIAELAAPGCTLIFDDIVDAKTADQVCEIVGAARRVLTRDLHPGRRKRCKIMLAEKD